MTSNRKYTILFSGGGTGGSVTPLLAVAEELLKDNVNHYRLIFVGTADGPERNMVTHFNQEIGPLEFQSIAGGKWRRYFSWSNVTDLLKIVKAGVQSWYLLGRDQADLVISAGSFVSVPLVWAAQLRRIPSLIHQQDVRPGLANKLMAPWAAVVTVALEKSLLDYGPKAVFIGNPMRTWTKPDVAQLRDELRNSYGLDTQRPIVLVTGGRMGARALNNLLIQSRELLTDFQIVHITGEAMTETAQPAKLSQSGYVSYQSRGALPNQEMLKLMAAATVVVSRCGLGTLTELSLLHKAAILIPLPDSHQADNAAVFKQAAAAVVLEQADLTPARLAQSIRQIVEDKTLKANLENNISKVIKPGASEKLVGIIEEILSSVKLV
jgi:UDP-N-acetylglucosamine--N-acetylmuramyl-(pentapeptide) pyrophosphoryl-undecaprenol N-acetylglucosamine transferase